jgi:AcrR family transcriptional regulator
MPRHPLTDTRHRIEQAAIRLFVQKGVTETTVRDIAGALNLSEGALYRHFESKDDLVWQLFERHYVDFGTRLHTLADGAETTRDKLAAMIHGFCRAHDEQPDLFHFLLFVQHGQLNKLRTGTPTPLAAVRRVVAQGIAAGDIPDQSVDVATALVFGVVLQPMQFAAYGRIPSTMTPLSERLVRAAWAAIAAACRTA